MSKTKKLLIALMLLIAVLLLPNMVNAAVEATETTLTSTGIEVKWSYDLSGDNITNLKCTNITSLTGELTIPSTIDEYNVTTIASYAFKDCTGLTGIILPNSITSIGNEAFRNCSGLASITLPTNITQIDSSTFRNCSGLASITLPTGVTSIGNYAFADCTGLTNITIPDSVTTLGENAFYRCSSLNDITLSNNLTKLNKNTFEGCSSLQEIVLPNNLTTISGGGWLEAVFKNCSSLKFIKIPERVVSISESAFYGCENLTIYGVAGSVAETYARNNNINFENIENWDNRNQNAGADITAPTVSKMNLKYSNLIGYYNSTTNDYRIPKGVEIVIIVEFSEQITGTNIPTLTIKCGTGNNIELNNGTISGENIVYTYTIQQADEGLITAVNLTGGNITDSEGNEAVLNVKELVGEHSTGYVYADGTKNATDNSQQESVDTTTYVSFPFIIYNGKGSVDLKSGVDIDNYTMYYQFIEISDEVYNKITDLQNKYKNKEITYEEYFVQYNETITKYNESNWTKTEDGSFKHDLNEFTGTKKFALWVKLVMDDKTVYESQIYKMNGSGTATNEPGATQKPTTTDKDTTTAKDNLPNTGKVILMWIIGIVAVSGIVARIRYKKLYM